MVRPGDGHGFFVEEAGIGHLDRRPDVVVVGDTLLSAEDVQRFADDVAARDVLGLALFGVLLKVLGHHFRPMDHGQVERRHRESLYACGSRSTASAAAPRPEPDGMIRRRTAANRLRRAHHVRLEARFQLVIRNLRHAPTASHQARGRR